MQSDHQPDHIRKRVVLHFPGFEPLDADQHHARYARSAVKTARLWDVHLDVGSMNGEGQGETRFFNVQAEGSGWQTSSRVYIFDHSDLVIGLNKRTPLRRLAGGYASAARVIVDGGALAYCTNAWRFGLFFIFPFLLVGLALAVSLAIAALPYWSGFDAWTYILSIPIAGLFFFRLFLPWSNRFHTLHLFDDWELAVAMAGLDKPEITQWLEECAAKVRLALNDEADEYLITSHSMGSSIAAHVIGMLLEREPALFEGKRVAFVTLGGAILQCALLRKGKVLRARVGAIARARQIRWIEIQCLTDIIHFYKCPVVKLSRHADAPQPRITFIRIKHMLSAERYRKIRRDFLRVHRQYVLDADLRAPFDFTLMTSGPLPAASFADFTIERLPQIPAQGATGTVISNSAP